VWRAGPSVPRETLLRGNRFADGARELPKKISGPAWTRTRDLRMKEHSISEEGRGLGSVCDPNGALRQAARGILLAAAEGREVEWAV
jgi:hypothetical protein